MPVVDCRTIQDVEWTKPPADAIVNNSAVHLYCIQISAHTGETDYYFALLSQGEKERALAYRHSRDYNRFIICRGTLRILLAQYARQNPEDIQINPGKNKKPFELIVGGSEIHYNVAHSGDWILIAIAGSAVGIDIEYIDGRFDYQEVLPACFSDAEKDFILASKAPPASFYLLWTRKEALLKATGKGIDDDMKSVPCLDGLHQVDGNSIGSSDDWTVTSIEITDGYIAAITHGPQVQGLILMEL